MQAAGVQACAKHFSKFKIEQITTTAVGESKDKMLMTSSR